MGRGKRPRRAGEVLLVEVAHAQSRLSRDGVEQRGRSAACGRIRPRRVGEVSRAELAHARRRLRRDSIEQRERQDEGCIAMQTAETLRDAGLSVVLHGGGGSFKSQMKKADASLANYAVLIGDDEAAANQVTLKALRGEFGKQPEQQRLALSEVIELLKTGL